MDILQFLFAGVIISSQTLECVYVRTKCISSNDLQFQQNHFKQPSHNGENTHLYKALFQVCMYSCSGHILGWARLCIVFFSWGVRTTCVNNLRVVHAMNKWHLPIRTALNQTICGTIIFTWKFTYRLSLYISMGIPQTTRNAKKLQVHVCVKMRAAVLTRKQIMCCYSSASFC
jgi:hypothetical protein